MLSPGAMGMWPRWSGKGFPQLLPHEPQYQVSNTEFSGLTICVGLLGIEYVLYLKKPPLTSRNILHP
jgi:hypothetical protein